MEPSDPSRGVQVLVVLLTLLLQTFGPVSPTFATISHSGVPKQTEPLAGSLTYHLDNAYAGNALFGVPPDADIQNLSVRFLQDPVFCTSSPRFRGLSKDTDIRLDFLQFWFRSYKIVFPYLKSGYSGENKIDPLDDTRTCRGTVTIEYTRKPGSFSEAINADPLADSVSSGLIDFYRPEWRAYPRYEVTRNDEFQGLPDAVFKYIIISDEEYAEVLRPLIQLKYSQGMPTFIATTQWIYSTYRAQSQQQKIWHFLRDAFNSWQPEYVLIVGDENTVPSWEISRFDVRYGEVNRDSDWNYVHLDGEDDSPSDLFPEMLISRIPVAGKDVLASVISKILGYYTRARVGEWTRRVLVVGGSDTSDLWIRMAQDFSSKCLPPEYLGIKLLSGYNLTRGNFIDEIMRGVSIVVTYSHGSKNGLQVGPEESSGYYLSVDDASSLNNEEMLPFMDLDSCYTFSLGMMLLQNPIGGTVAFTANKGWIMRVLPLEYGDILYKLVFATGPIRWYSYRQHVLDSIRFRPFRISDCMFFKEILQQGYLYGGIRTLYYGDPDMSLLGYQNRNLLVERTEYSSLNRIFTIKVTDRNLNRPVPNVLVRAVNEKFFFEFTTDANGEVRFRISPSSMNSGVFNATVYVLNYNAPVPLHIFQRVNTDFVTTSIILSASPSKLKQYEPVAVVGKMSPVVGGALVVLTYVRPDSTNFTRTATTSEDGSFSDSYAPRETGIWRVISSWEGDETHAPARSAICEFEVLEAPFWEHHGASLSLGIFAMALFLLGLVYCRKRLATVFRRSDRMKACPRCGTAVAGQDDYCMECGARVSG